MEFFKIAENEYDRERLLRQSNIATTLFLAEAHYDIHLLYERLVQLFEQEEDREALKVFLNWFAQLATHGYRPTADYELVEREFKNIEEVKSMLMTAIERDREQLLKTGEARGVQIGEARGVQIGEARGLQIGEAKGKAEGKRERDRQIVQAMSKANYPIDVIAGLLDLDVEQVQTLATEISPATVPARRPRAKRTKQGQAEEQK